MNQSDQMDLQRAPFFNAQWPAGPASRSAAWARWRSLDSAPLGSSFIICHFLFDSPSTLSRCTRHAGQSNGHKHKNTSRRIASDLHTAAQYCADQVFWHRFARAAPSLVLSVGRWMRGSSRWWMHEFLMTRGCSAQTHTSVNPWEGPGFSCPCGRCSFLTQIWWRIVNACLGLSVGRDKLASHPVFSPFLPWDVCELAVGFYNLGCQGSG